MEITIPYIERKFDEFNRLIFDGKLPRIPVQLTNAKSFLGQCVYKKHRNFLGMVRHSDFRLKISTRITLSEQEIEDTIIHEMIHYHIAYHHLKDTSSHGTLFRKMMDDINVRFGRHITISHKSTKEEKEEAIAKQVRLRVVAVVSFDDGRTGIKVLPRTLPSILKYYNAVVASSGVERVQLYMSKNTYFGRYPSSAVLRIHFVELQKLMEELKDARKMKCDGKSLS